MHANSIFKAINFIYLSKALVEFGCNLCRHSIHSTAFSTVPHLMPTKNDINSNDICDINVRIQANLCTYVYGFF